MNRGLCLRGTGPGCLLCVDKLRPLRSIRFSATFVKVPPSRTRKSVYKRATLQTRPYAHQGRARIVMLQTTEGIFVASRHRPDPIATADEAAIPAPHPRRASAPKSGTDREKWRNFACNAAAPSDIRRYRSTCELSFPDAEFVQRINKGRAPFFGWVPRKTLYRMDERVTGLTSCSLESYQGRR